MTPPLFSNFAIMLQVRFIESTVHEGHSTLDFVISSRYDDYELKVRKISSLTRKLLTHQGG